MIDHERAPHKRPMALRGASIRKAFLESLVEQGNVRAAARGAGIHAATAYRYRARFKRFADEWDAAIAANADLRMRTGADVARYSRVAEAW